MEIDTKYGGMQLASIVSAPWLTKARVADKGQPVGYVVRAHVV